MINFNSEGLISELRFIDFGVSVIVDNYDELKDCKGFTIEF